MLCDVDASVTVDHGGVHVQRLRRLAAGQSASEKLAAESAAAAQQLALGKQKQQQLVYQMQACQQPQPPLTSTTPS
jgi:hypothetical protein